MGVTAVVAELLAVVRGEHDHGAGEEVELVEDVEQPSEVMVVPRDAVEAAMRDDDALRDYLIAGELSLDGGVRPVRGALPIAVCAREAGVLGARYPGFGWERNAGYGTAEHRAGLDSRGVTEHHRRSFKPIAALLSSP